MIVFLEPVADGATRLLDRCKQPAIETAIVPHPVKALIMSVLPQTLRVNKVGLDTLLPQPGRPSLGNELGTIVTLHVAWTATLSKQLLQDLDDLIGCNRPSTGDGEPLPGGLVQDRQVCQPPPIGGLIMAKS